MKRKSRNRRWVLWCGFIDGKPAPLTGKPTNIYGEGLDKQKTRLALGYADVRRVEVKLVEARSRGTK